MRILVCIKQVPVMAVPCLVQGRWTLQREGLEGQISEHDLQALEAALRLREARDGEVIVLTMGPPHAEEALREALARGADRALLLSDPAFAGADTLATSTTLAQAIRRLESPDLILCGARTSDSGTGQVGPQLAEDLGIPHVAYVEEVLLEGNSILVRRTVDRFRETIRLRRLPTVLTFLRIPNPPRQVPLHRIHEAFDVKPLERWGLRKLGLSPDQVGAAGSATRVIGFREPPAQRKARVLRDDPDRAVEEILQALDSRLLLNVQGGIHDRAHNPPES